MDPTSPTDLEYLYAEHAPALHAFLLNLTRNEADTKDLLQELFCMLAARPGVLVGVENVRSWMMKTVWRRWIDQHRRSQVRQRHAEAQPVIFATSEDPDEAMFRQALSAALEELPDEQRAVVHLKLWEGLTFLEIADVLGIPANTAGSRYRYGIDKLRDLLRPVYEEL